MDDPSFAQEWGPLIAAFFAALAAGASWVSALHARRTWRDSQRPQLAARLHAYKGYHGLLRVRNVGGGPAKNISFMVVLNNREAVGHLPPDGYLTAGQAVSVEMLWDTHVDADPARFVVMCLDRENNTYGWSREGESKIFKREPSSPVRDIGWMFERFYGPTEQDMEHLPWRTTTREG
jgi:hypothetical protein